MFGQNDAVNDLKGRVVVTRGYTHAWQEEKGTTGTFAVEDETNVSLESIRK